MRVRSIAYGVSRSFEGFQWTSLSFSSMRYYNTIQFSFFMSRHRHLAGSYQVAIDVEVNLFGPLVVTIVQTVGN